MEYIKLINNYWQLREQGILSASQGDMYLYFLHTSNKLGWKNPFTQSNALICAILDISEPTLIRNRNILKQAGLIEFESGKASRKPTVYYLNNLSSSVSSVVSSSVSSVVSSVDENPLDNTRHKQDYTKQNKTKLSDESFSSGGEPPDTPSSPQNFDLNNITGESNAQSETIDYRQFVDWFNEKTGGIFRKLIYPLGEKRRKLLRARIAEHGKESIIAAVEKALNSAFLRGQNTKGWTATFDWMIKPDNFEKILSGNYDASSSALPAAGSHLYTHAELHKKTGQVPHPDYERVEIDGKFFYRKKQLTIR